MPVRPDYPVANITNPIQNDILCGRGGGTNAHPGNIKFRKLVAAHKLRYLAASKSDKPGVARDVVREWRGMEPPGRFLAKMDPKNIPPHLNVGDEDERPTVWADVGDKKAREKASQCLRERNGAANEAVAALVKTVTASGEACPEDYATLMNKAALVKAQNELTIQQQNEMIKMNQQAQQMQRMSQQMGHQNNNMNGNGTMGGGQQGNNNFGHQEAFEPISLQQQQSRGGGGGEFSPQGGNNNYQDTHNEDDLIEAEIQRLLQQRQQQQLMRNQNNNSNSNGPGGNNNLSNNLGNTGGGVGGASPRGGGIMPNSSNGFNDAAPQPYMGEESVMREYEQLMHKQRELNMMAGKLNGMMGNNNNGMNSAGPNNNNAMGGMMNNGGPGMFNNNNNMMPQAPGSMGNSNGMGMSGMNGMGGMNNNGVNNNGMNNFGGNSQMPNQMGGGGGGGMQPNHNPDAAKDYMKRLRMLRQGGGGGNNPTNNSNMPDQATSSNLGGFNNNSNGLAGNGPMGSNGMGAGSNNMMGNMRNNMQQQQMQGGKAREEFTIEEYQASLQQFLSHNDDYGGGGGGNSSRNNNMNSGLQEPIMSRNKSEATRHAGNTALSQQQLMPGTIQCLQVPTNFDAGNGGGGSNKRNRRPSGRSVDDMDLPIGRNTFKSVESGDDRPSFQSSMDDMDIRGTFKSVDTMDLMSIGNSINEIMDDDIKQNPEMRKKYGRRMSNAASRSGMGGYHDAGKGGNDGGDGGGNNKVEGYAQLPGQTLEIRTMDHGQGGRGGGGGGGSKKKNKQQGGNIDQRLLAAQAGTRHSVQTKGCDGPKTAGMGGRNSQLSIKDFNLDGADDASRMSFGNMSIMSELTDFQDMMAKAEAFQHGDSFKDL